MKHIYGPVSSWRLGRSLGLDLTSDGKNCNFDCLYCQLGTGAEKVIKRRVFVPTDKLIAELKKLPPLEINYLTFSGSGEPTLAANLGEAISAVRKILPHKIAVLTNSLLISDQQVRAELSLADLVVAKLDAASKETFRKVNRPPQGFSLDKIIAGIKNFNRDYPGKLALQVMFVKENKHEAKTLADLAKEINPVEIQINTPLRTCPEKPLPAEELLKIKKLFEPLKVYCVYDAKRPQVEPLDKKATLKRRPT